MASISELSPLETQLRHSLVDVLMCLREHLAQEAHDSNVPLERLCPCTEDQVATAAALLKRIEEDYPNN